VDLFLVILEVLMRVKSVPSDFFPMIKPKSAHAFQLVEFHKHDGLLGTEMTSKGLAHIRHQ
jgi:hypothetical protein